MLQWIVYFLVLFSWTNAAYSAHLSKQGNLVCHQKSSCLLENIHVTRENTLHVHIRSSQWSTQYTFLRIHTGIGFNSPVLYFDTWTFQGRMNAPLAMSSCCTWTNIFACCERNRILFPLFPKESCSAYDFNLLKIMAFHDKQHEGESLDKRPIYVHFSPFDVDTNQIHMKPVAFISVIWPNLFRTLYAGLVALHQLLYWNIYFPGHVDFILLDNSHSLSSRFLSILESVASISFWTNDRALPVGYYKAIVIGSLPEALLPELETKPIRACDRLTDLQRKAYQTFSKSVLSAFKINYIPSNTMRVSVIVRRNTTRMFRSENDLITSLQTVLSNRSSLFKIEIYDFSLLAWHEQLRIIHHTDLLVAAHGAALSHILFMRPQSFVLELFSNVFYKSIFWHLSRVMQVSYLSWQSPLPDDEKDNVFHMNESVWRQFSIQNRTWTLERIRNVKRVIWTEMASREYWRQQHVRIESKSLSQRLNQLLNGRDEEFYLMYSPWEQFGNQMVAFMSACATAFHLKRVLVLPFVGYRIRQSSHRFQLFQMHDYAWQPMERYFSMSELPCKTIPLMTFVQLYSQCDWEANPLFYLLGGGQNTRVEQVLDYYRMALGSEVTVSVQMDNAPSSFPGAMHNSLTDIINKHGQDKRKLLTLSNLFRFYDFESGPMTPPPSGAYLQNELYQKILRNIEYRRYSDDHLPLFPAAIHVRRGNDLEAKCQLASEQDKEKCHVPEALLLERVTLLSVETVFVATNALPAEKKHWQELFHENRIHLVFVEDLIPIENRDPLQVFLVEMQICENAEIFIGNKYSTATQWIADRRKSLHDSESFYW